MAKLIFYSFIYPCCLPVIFTPSYRNTAKIEMLEASMNGARLMEELAAQSLAGNANPSSPADYASAIDAVTAQDVQAVGYY